MNKKMKIGLILVTYTILAGIPSVLGYLQYDKGESTPYGGGSCGTCHVVPNGSISTDISFSIKINRISDPEELKEINSSSELPVMDTPYCSGNNKRSWTGSLYNL